MLVDLLPFWGLRAPREALRVKDLDGKGAGKLWARKCRWGECELAEDMSVYMVAAERRYEGDSSVGHEGSCSLLPGVCLMGARPVDGSSHGKGVDPWGSQHMRGFAEVAVVGMAADMTVDMAVVVAVGNTPAGTVVERVIEDDKSADHHQGGWPLEKQANLGEIVLEFAGMSTGAGTVAADMVTEGDKVGLPWRCLLQEKQRTVVVPDTFAGRPQAVVPECYLGDWALENWIDVGSRASLGRLVLVVGGQPHLALLGSADRFAGFQSRLLADRRDRHDWEMLD
jgi:hypothetical protein